MGIVMVDGRTSYEGYVDGCLTGFIGHKITTAFLLRGPMACNELGVCLGYNTRILLDRMRGQWAYG